MNETDSSCAGGCGRSWLGACRRHVRTRPQPTSSKVGFIYVGPIGDFGWTYQHDLGRQAMEKALGDKVETTYLENVPEGADAERAIEQLARTGHKLIFTTSFGFMDATLKVAKKYPERELRARHRLQARRQRGTYAARFYEGRYVLGQIAAKMSKSGMIGYIVSFPIPGGDLRHQRLHARRAVGQPEHQGQDHLGELLVRPGQGSRRRQGAGRPGRRHPHPAHRLAGRDADRRAARHPSPSARSSDMIKFGPKAQLTADIDYWGDYYTERAKAVLDGKWKSRTPGAASTPAWS